MLRRRRRQNWLSAQVDEAMRDARELVSRSLQDRLRDFSTPKFRMIAFVGGGYLLSFIASWGLSKVSIPRTGWCVKPEDLVSIYNTMWQVQAAISGVGLPILLFVIELAKDVRQATTRSHEVLIRESLILPVIMFALAGVVRIGIDIIVWPHELVMVFDLIFVFIATVAGAVLSYFFSVRLLFSASTMRTRGLVLVREKTATVLDESIRIRIANNILARKLEELRVERWIFTPERREDEYFVVRSNRLGVVSDVQLAQLEEIVWNLPWKPLVLQEALAREESGPRRSSLGRRAIYVWTLAGVGDRLTERRDGLIRIQRSAFGELEEGPLANAVNAVFEVSSDTGTTREDLNTELGYFLDSLMEAIAARRSSAVKDGLAAYEEIVDEFLLKIVSHGSPYDRERARQEAGIFQEGWSEIELVKDHVRELIDTALDTSNGEVIRQVISFPIRLSSLAVRSRDFFVFNKFIQWVTYCYRRAHRLQDKELRAFVVDRCWRYLQETAELIIKPEIRQSETVEEVGRLSEFAVEVVRIYNDLLKEAFDRRRLSDAKSFVTSLVTVNESFVRDSETEEVRDLRWRLENDNLADDAKAELSAELALREAIVKGAVEARKASGLVRFGLVAWILSRYEKGWLTEAEIQPWLGALAGPTTIDEAWSLLLEALKREAALDLRWHWWESDEQPAGRVMSSAHFESYLLLAFSIYALKAMKDLPIATRQEIQISPAPELHYLMTKPDGILRRVLAVLQTPETMWLPIVGGASLASIELTSALERALSAQVSDERRRIDEAPLAAEKVRAVRVNIIEEWRRNADVRTIIRRYGNYDFRPDRTGSDRVLSVYRLNPKEIFVEESNVGMSGWGEQYGRDLAIGENEEALKCIVTAVDSAAQTPLAGDDLFRAVDDSLARIGGGDGMVILVLNSWATAREFERRLVRQEQRTTDKPRVLGLYSGVPVYSLRYRGRPMLIVADLRQLGVWRQTRAVKLLDEEQYFEELSFGVHAFTEDNLDAFVAANPRQLQDSEGQPRQRAEVENELMGQVLLRVAERFTFEVATPIACAQIPIVKESRSGI